ncbi:SRPBCC family protein [Nocardioides sp.]|uniref:SRPBCC family protein n=1 Tax=Nocardioides sp. TaxID=35761 RepID=UPI002732D0CE|nr:SRPBCC family protein [Nocardioides sp.]MDP3894928.1 SRPBCC family protein [Nocardioides sp.]
MAGHVIHIHTVIPAPPAVIWEVITDVGRAAEVLRSVSSSELVTDGPYDVGTVWREERTMFGHHGEEELRVVSCEPPLRTRFETRVGHDTIVTSYSMTPTPHGETSSHGETTRLSQTTTVVMSDRTRRELWAWKFFGAFSFEATRRMLQHDLEDISAEVSRRFADQH